MSKETRLKIERSARIWTHGNLSKKTKNVWLVAHGYGQLAEYFIKHFEHLDPDANFVIAPEGLSRAYINGMAGRVGASWMTKEMREAEIEDYLSYLDNVVNHFMNKFDLKQFNLVALGFSQGAATISRWVEKNILKVKTMYLWGGQPAKELQFSQNLNKLPIIFVIGNNDPYISGEMKQHLTEEAKKNNWCLEVVEYVGEHHLKREVISFLETKI